MFQIIYNKEAERQAKAAGFNPFPFERRVRPYVQMLETRKEAMSSGDVALFNYAFSASFDAEKHAAHNEAVAAVKEMEAQTAKLGFHIFVGDLENRQQIGRFACLFVGEVDLAQFAD